MTDEYLWTQLSACNSETKKLVLKAVNDLTYSLEA